MASHNMKSLPSLVWLSIAYLLASVAYNAWKFSPLFYTTPASGDAVTGIKVSLQVCCRSLSFLRAEASRLSVNCCLSGGRDGDYIANGRELSIGHGCAPVGVGNSQLLCHPGNRCLHLGPDEKRHFALSLAAARLYGLKLHAMIALTGGHSLRSNSRRRLAQRTGLGRANVRGRALHEAGRGWCVAALSRANQISAHKKIPAAFAAGISEQNATRGWSTKQSIGGRSTMATIALPI